MVKYLIISNSVLFNFLDLDLDWHTCKKLSFVVMSVCCAQNMNVHRVVRTLLAINKFHEVANLCKSKFYTSVNKKLLAKQGSNEAQRVKIRSTLYYISAAGVLTIGLSYAAVPLYRMFCQAYSYGGVTATGHDSSKVESMLPVSHRPIKIKFNADIGSSMRWSFKPQQTEITVLPGETALAFYTALNPTDAPIIGISTYNVVPFEAGQYFNKIQCFCFEEQQLNPHEQVDMPVFFYIDPEFIEDPKMELVEEITLSYTFFEAKDGLQLPMPSFIRK